MSTPSESDVRAAIDTIQTSYSYDPPSRWLEAHRLLRSLRLTLDQQFEPYRWISTVGSVLGFASLFWLIWAQFKFSDDLWSIHPVFSALIVSTAFLMPTAIMSAFYRLARTLATRRHPLMKFKDQIKAPSERFEDKYIAAASSPRS